MNQHQQPQQHYNQYAQGNSYGHNGRGRGGGVQQMNGNPHSGYANGSNAHNGYANQPHSPPSSHQQQRQSSLTSPRGHYGGHRSSHQGRDSQLQHMKASKSKLLLNLEKYKDKNLEDMGSGGGALADSGLAQTNLGLAQETV